jgi:hypothetical protein
LLLKSLAALNKLGKVEQQLTVRVPIDAALRAEDGMEKLADNLVKVDVAVVSANANRNAE